MKPMNLTKAIEALTAANSARTHLSFIKSHHPENTREITEAQIASQKADETFMELTEALESLLETVQKRCTVRTLSATELITAVKDLENHLYPCSKKALTGVKVRIDYNHQSFPSAYSYIPESTIIDVERHPSGWFLHNVYRGTCTSVLYRWSCVPEETKASILKSYFG